MKNYIKTATGVILLTSSLQATTVVASANENELALHSQSAAKTSEIDAAQKSAATSEIQNQVNTQVNTVEMSSSASPELFLQQVRINSKLQAAEAAFNLGILAAKRNDYVLAMTLIEESIQLNQANPNYLAFAAAIAFLTQEYDKAVSYQMKVLEIARTEPGADEQQLAQLLDQLGTIYFKQKDYEKAKSSLTESLQLREKILGDSHPQVVVNLNKLAALAIRQQQSADAETLLKRSLDITREVSGPRHANTATMLATLADFYQGEARLQEAETLYKDAISIWSDSSPDPITLAVARNSLGRLLLTQRRFEDARLQFDQVLVLLKQNYPQDHPNVQQAIKNLADLDVIRERSVESGAMYDELVREFSVRSEKHM